MDPTSIQEKIGASIQISIHDMCNQLKFKFCNHEIPLTIKGMFHRSAYTNHHRNACLNFHYKSTWTSDLIHCLAQPNDMPSHEQFLLGPHPIVVVVHHAYLEVYCAHISFRLSKDRGRL